MAQQRLPLIVALVFASTSSAHAQGRPAPEFWSATLQTTVADAHVYIKRVLATVRLRDQFETSPNEHRLRGYRVDDTDASGCKARLRVETTRTARVSGSETTKVTDYMLDFRTIVEVTGDEHQISFIGRIPAETTTERTPGKFEVAPGQADEGSARETKSVVKRLDLYLETKPYDLVKALGFVVHKCLGGKGFKPI